MGICHQVRHILAAKRGHICEFVCRYAYPVANLEREWVFVGLQTATERFTNTLWHALSAMTSNLVIVGFVQINIIIIRRLLQINIFVIRRLISLDSR